ncbi:MAG: MFS transporter [Desulfotignum sp.]|nr:MFS transporter [Desulfotignum sp.]
MNTQFNTHTSGSAYLPLFFLTAIFFMNFTIRISISPLMPTILTDMALTRDQAGSFFLFSASGYCIALFFSGFVSARLRHRNTIVLSAMGTGIVFIFTGFSQSLSAMRLGIFLAGAGSGLYLSSGIAVLTATIARKNWGKALGVHELAPNLSFLLTPVICELLLLWMTWRQVLFVLGGVSILLGWSFSRFSSIQDFAGEAPRLKSFRPLAAIPSFWWMMLLFSLGVSGTLGVYSMLPLFLVNEHGMVQTQANTLVTLSRIATLPMPLVIGWIADRMGLKPVIAAVLMLKWCAGDRYRGFFRPASAGRHFLPAVAGGLFFPAGLCRIVQYQLPSDPQRCGLFYNSGRLSDGWRRNPRFDRSSG